MALLDEHETGNQIGDVNLPSDSVSNTAFQDESSHLSWIVLDQVLPVLKHLYYTEGISTAYKQETEDIEKNTAK